MNNLETEQLDFKEYQQIDVDVNEKEIKNVNKKFWYLLLEIIILSALGTLFYIFSTTEGLINDASNCTALNKSGAIYGDSMLIFAVMKLGVLVYYCENKLKVISYFEKIRTVELIAYTTEWVQMWVRFSFENQFHLSKGEDCSDLTILIWIFTGLIIVIFLGLLCYKIWLIYIQKV